jgi:hypothetical protein
VQSREIHAYVEPLTVEISALHTRHISFTISPNPLTLAFLVSLTPLIHQTWIDFAKHEETTLVEGNSALNYLLYSAVT